MVWMSGIRLYSTILVAFLLCGTVLYSEALEGFFLSDDFVILDAISRRGPFGIWTHSDSDFFRPAMSFFFFVGYKVWHLNAAGFHLANILVHSLNSFLVFLLAQALIPPPAPDRKRLMLAMVSGFAFLIMPSHSEPVSWIAARTDVIAAFLSLGSLYAYLAYRHHGKRSNMLISISLFVCALLSKESSIGLPFILAFYEAYSYFSAHRTLARLRRGLALSIPYFGSMALYFLLRYLFLGTAVGGYGRGVHLTFHPFRLLINLASFPTRTLIPPMPTRIAAVGTFTAVALCVIATLYILAARRRQPIPRILYFLVGSYLLALLPVINLSISKVDTEGERYVYLPSVFAVILVVLLLDFMLRNRKALSVVLLCLFVAFGVQLHKSNSNWAAASDAARGIIESAGTLGSGDRLFVLNLPDKIRGAYVFRNGFREALSLSETGAFLSVIRKDRSGYLVFPRLSADGMYSTEDYEIVAATAMSYNIRIKDISEEDRIAVYSSGMLKAYDSR
jgi:hypothetical protein